MHINLEKGKGSLGSGPLVCPTPITLAMFPIEHRVSQNQNQMRAVCDRLSEQRHDRSVIVSKPRQKKEYRGTKKMQYPLSANTGDW